MSIAVTDSKQIADWLSIPAPHLYSILPSVFKATVAVGVIILLAALIMACIQAAPSRHLHRFGRLRHNTTASLGVAGFINFLLYGLLVLFIVMAAVTALFFSSHQIMDKATGESADILPAIDHQIQELIYNSVKINSTKSGWKLYVGKANRPVDIGRTTCGLFCFALARALLSDESNCTCNPEILLQIQEVAASSWRHALQPALVCVAIAVLAVAALLMVVSAGFTWSAAQRLMGQDKNSKDSLNTSTDLLMPACKAKDLDNTGCLTVDAGVNNA
eukprot:jgi/Chrzof1/2953/Cz12g05200.t1